MAASELGAQGWQRDETGRALADTARAKIRDPNDFVYPYQSDFTGREAFTAPRGAAGRCHATEARPKRVLQPNAENAFVGEWHERACSGVFYFTFIPPQYRVANPPPKPNTADSATVRVFRVPGSDTGWVPTREDTLTIKRLAGTQSQIDTAKAQFKFAGDSAWIWSKLPNGSTGMKLVRVQGRWLIQQQTDTTTVTPPTRKLPMKPAGLLVTHKPRSFVDSQAVRMLAISQSPHPENAKVWQLAVRGDTAFVRMLTGSFPQNLLYVRKNRSWTLVPDRPALGGR
jgi:hypothetical protein